MSKSDDMTREVKIQDIEKRLDDRGFFAEIMREDWRAPLSDQVIKQVSLSSAR